jgi:NADH:ubiquinone oxidoreductase subunit H
MIDILLHIVLVIGIMLALVLIAAGLIWLERRTLALWQDRYGPNRTGLFGTLQVAADMIKIFFKEDWIPRFADKKVFDQYFAQLCRGSFYTSNWRGKPEYRPAVFPGHVFIRRL